MSAVPYAPLLESCEERVVVHLDPVEARKLVRRLRGVSLFVRTGVDLATDLDEDGRPTRCYPDMGGNVPVSARVADKMLADLERFNDRKASIDQSTGVVRVTRLGRCLFLG